jgi:hypothetical protein
VDFGSDNRNPPGMMPAPEKQLARQRAAPDTSAGPRLKDVRVAIIDVECRACGLKGSYDRAVLVKLHGASLSFARLRRQAALGCERITGPEGDKRQTRFPCLEAPLVE